MTKERVLELNNLTERELIIQVLGRIEQHSERLDNHIETSNQGRTEIKETLQSVKKEVENVKQDVITLKADKLHYQGMYNMAKIIAGIITGTITLVWVLVQIHSKI